jgi:nucleoside-diphosphate-sugar epimerase
MRARAPGPTAPASPATWLERAQAHRGEPPARRERRLNGTSDMLDAKNAARAVLAGTRHGNTKGVDGAVQMLRQIAKDTAMKHERERW